MSHRPRLEQALDLLCCPRTHEPLRLEGERLVAGESGWGYRVLPSGVPLFAEEFVSPGGERQRAHYERVAASYQECLDLPQTQEYLRFHDRLVLDQLPGEVGTLVELCCGRGEAARLEGLRYRRLVGVDVSEWGLELGLRSLQDPRVTLVQGDATRAPLRSGCADAVVILGGIHHVPDRAALYGEVARLLRPGGRFVWREPVSDFLPWRMARALIYRLSPALDEQDEQPLRQEETVAELEQAGLVLEAWRTSGFLAWCLLANADVLVFNRALRFLPAVRRVARLGVSLDEAALRLPGLGLAGTQVVGAARKP